MKLIVKSKSSSLHHKLIAFKNDINGTYENIKKDLKEDLLISLLKEQGYICAYCMKKINQDNSTIEHIIGQKYKDGNIDLGKENELKYENLLAVCLGNSCKELNCDKSRSKYQEKRPLYVNPLENRIMTNIKFTNNGLIFYEDFIEIDKIKEFKNHNSHLESENIKYDIQKILNLNCNDLKEKRKVLIEALKKYTNNWSDKEKIRKKLQIYELKYNSEYEELCQVAIYFLSKKL